MSKNKRIARRRQALITRLAQGEDLATILKKLHISPGRAVQILASDGTMASPALMKKNTMPATTAM